MYWGLLWGCQNPALSSTAPPKSPEAVRPLQLDAQLPFPMASLTQGSGPGLLPLTVGKGVCLPQESLLWAWHGALCLQGLPSLWPHTRPRDPTLWETNHSSKPMALRPFLSSRAGARRDLAELTAEPSAPSAPEPEKR